MIGRLQNNSASFIERSYINAHLKLYSVSYSGALWSSGRVVERRTFGRRDRGSKPPVAEHRTFHSKGQGFKTACGRASDFSVEWTGVQNHLLPFQNLGNFVLPTLPVSFGRDTKSRWSLLPGVYARGSKISNTGGKCVTGREFKEWWSLSLTHQFPARERRRAGLTTLLRSPVLGRKQKQKIRTQLAIT